VIRINESEIELLEAWERVKVNQGSGGIDGISIGHATNSVANELGRTEL